jgi:hypothetical protein
MQVLHQLHQLRRAHQLYRLHRAHRLYRLHRAHRALSGPVSWLAELI